MAGKRKNMQLHGGVAKATTAVILDAAETFSGRQQGRSCTRTSAARPSLSAVLARDEGLIASAAPANPDLIESTSLMFRHGLGQDGLPYTRLVVRAALDGLPYDRTPGKFEGTERLIELAEQAAASAPPAERTMTDLEPRLVVAAAVALFLGWGAAQSWVRPAAGLQDMDDAELVDGIERVLLGILRANVPGVGRGDASRGE